MREIQQSSHSRGFMLELALGALAALFTSGIFSAAAAEPSEKQKKPNIVFILADDLGWRDLACYGSRYHKTPNIDRLAQRSLRFTQAYSASPLCSPTRSSILTGLAPARIGITVPICHQPEVILASAVATNATPKKRWLEVQSATRLKTEYFTLAESLRAAGYATAHFGKWHLGAEPYSPLQQGFDVDLPHTSAPGPYPGGYLGPWSYWPGQGKAGEHIEDRMAQEAVRFIKAHKDEPFFVNYWAFSVHAPFTGKPGLIERYRKKPLAVDEKQRCPEYAAMVQSLDDAVGTLVKTLDEEGLWDRTVVVFFSDNGGNMYDRVGENTPTSNEPLRSGKASYYEGGTRVPCVIHWPGFTKPGTTSDALLMSTDFFPTFCDVLGTAAPSVPFDGKSFAPLLRGQAFDRGPLYCHFPHPMGKIGPYPASWVREGDWKLIRLYNANNDLSDRFELYNLREDIGETRDLSTLQPERLSVLRAKLEGFLRDTGAVLPKPNPAYDPALHIEVAGWRAVHDAKLQPQKANLLLQSLSDDPQMATELATPLQGPLRIQIRMKSSSPGGAAVYWTSGNKPWHRDRAVFFTPLPDGEWHDYALELPAKELVADLRFDPASAPGAIWIERITLLSAQGEKVKEWAFDVSPEGSGENPAKSKQ